MLNNRCCIAFHLCRGLLPITAWAISSENVLNSAICKLYYQKVKKFTNKSIFLFISFEKSQKPIFSRAS